MCDTSAQHCDRSHVVTPASTLLKDHTGTSTCGPSCECACHEIVTHDLDGRTYSGPTLIRRQHPGWRLAMWVYSDRWMEAAA